MNESILESIKKLVGIDSESEHFDPDLIIHINTVLMTLNQLGVGPDKTFHITGEEELWEDFVQNEEDLEGIKTFTYLKVRLLFDPPTSSFVLDSMRKLADEYEWRLMIIADTTKEEEV